MILLLYVDNMRIVGSNMHYINALKNLTVSTFSMKDLGDANQILGMHITRDKKIKK